MSCIQVASAKRWGITGFITILCLVMATWRPVPTYALIEPFNPSFILTDEEFNDAGAMSCEAIQAFLNERPGILKNYIDENKTAAQIFCEHANAFSINPRILLVLAQKEMRVLTDPEPDDKQLAWALGCGPGWDSTRGLNNQAECAARTLRKRFDNATVGDVIDGVTPINRGTLALYRYTNHIWGNQDFHKIWVNYWPNTAASAPAATGGPAQASAAAPAPSVAAAPAATNDLPVVTPTDAVIVDSRNTETTPPLRANSTCRSGWAAGNTGLGGHLFVTPNSASAAESTNWAIWRPTLSVSGLYRVSVYVPDRAAVAWACGKLAAVLDTTNAQYEIHHLNGVSVVQVNQAPLANAWVSLGNFYFATDGSGYIKLSDVTGEPSNTRWVSFDDVKFEWMQ